jgi:hypothetical protein
MNPILSANCWPQSRSSPVILGQTRPSCCAGQTQDEPRVRLTMGSATGGFSSGSPRRGRWQTRSQPAPGGARGSVRQDYEPRKHPSRSLFLFSMLWGDHLSQSQRGPYFSRTQKLFALSLCCLRQSHPKGARWPCSRPVAKETWFLLFLFFFP